MLPALTLAPHRVALVEVFGGTPWVVHAAMESNTLFRVSLSIPGGAQRILEGCEQRGFQVPQVQVDRHGTARLFKVAPVRRRDDGPADPDDGPPCVNAAPEARS